MGACMTKLMVLQWARLWRLLSPIHSWDITERDGLGVTVMEGYFTKKGMLVIYLQFLKIRINRQHSNMKYTMETEKHSQLPFLDVLVYNKPNLVTSVYRKPTCTGLSTIFLVLHLLNIKMVSLKLCSIYVTKSRSHGKVLITI